MKLDGLGGKRAFVTGAAGGIGRAVVRLLDESGATVIASDVDGDALALLAESCQVRTERLDVRDSEAVDAVVASIEQEDGPIDFGINVAGALSIGRVTEASDEDWRKVFDVNATGVFNVSRALARRMLERGQGSLVTVSSNAAGVPRQGMAAYAASKAAASMFTRSLGLELAPHGIRCNVVAPGSTLTPMQTGLWDDPDGGSAVIRGSLETFKPGIPLGRIAGPEDIAAAVLFLLSDQARHVTMAELYVDGGASLRG